MRGSRWLVFPLLLTAALAAQDRRVVPADGGSRRLALVIGNNAYPWKPLTNAVNDAKAFAAALTKVGFQPGDVTLVTNTSLRELQRAARQFLEKLKPNDVALVYYSGHGVEVHGENFLIPVASRPMPTNWKCRTTLIPRSNSCATWKPRKRACG
jgi:hypothetical protein